LAAISIGQREFERWNLDVSALRCVRSGSTSRHFKRQASQEFWIQDYNGTSKMLTFTAVGTAPTAGDAFIIV